MRDIVFLVADNECAATLRGLLDLPTRHFKLGCAPFQFDPALDLIVHPQKDPGVFSFGHLLLATKRKTHQRAVIILDEAWDGSPGAAAITAGIAGRVTAIPWMAGAFTVICIAPELETWIWQNNPNVDAAFGFGGPNLRIWLRNTADFKGGQVIAPDPLAGLNALWPAGNPKPPDPKRAVEVTRAFCGSGPPSGVFNEITKRVSLCGCVDGAFLALRTTLQTWFPAGGGAV